MTEDKVTLREVLLDRMCEIENHFVRQEHLDPVKKATIEDKLAWMSKMWRLIGEDDREWLQYAQHALEDQTPWK